MKKRQLFSLIITALLLCALLPTLAFADPQPDNSTIDPPLAELASGDTMGSNNGCITTNNGTITTNNSGITTNNGTITTNNGTVTTNNGTVTTNYDNILDNSGIVENNNGTVENNKRTVRNNYGRIDANNGTVTNNFGTITNNNVNVINNFGAASVGGNVAPQYQLWQVNVSGRANTTFSDVIVTDDGKLWVKEGTSAVISPASGYAITAATTSNGTITKGTDGKWTLTGVTAAANVTVAANDTPKTGVDRDTGILTALALVSGIILVTALPKKKTGTNN